ATGGGVDRQHVRVVRPDAAISPCTAPEAQSFPTTSIDWPHVEVVGPNLYLSPCALGRGGATRISNTIVDLDFAITHWSGCYIWPCAPTRTPRRFESSFQGLHNCS